MIRVNLLAVERTRAKRRASFDLGQKGPILGTLILLVSALGIGWWYWSLRQASQQLDDDLAAAQTEVQRLQTVLTRVQQFEATRRQLQERVGLIEQLRKGQTVPVHMLDEVSKSLPERAWLTEMTQDGNNVFLKGRSVSLTAVSDFVGNLETTGFFAKPVEIVDSQVEQQQQGTAGQAAQDSTELVLFEIKAQISPAIAPPATAPATGLRR